MLQRLVDGVEGLVFFSCQRAFWPMTDGCRLRRETQITRLTLAVIQGSEPGAKGRGARVRVITKLSCRVEQSDPKLGEEKTDSIGPRRAG